MPVITSASLGLGQPSKIGPFTLIGSNGTPLFLAVCGRPADRGGFVGTGTGAFAAGAGSSRPIPARGTATLGCVGSADAAEGGCATSRKRIRRIRRPVDRLQRRLRQRFARRQRSRLLELGHRQLRRAKLLFRAHWFWRRGLRWRKRRLLVGRGTTRHVSNANIEEKPSFPRSAWERTVCDVLRRPARRGASEDADSHAERGNQNSLNRFVA